MLNIIKTAALAILVGVGAIGATATSAKADSLYIGFSGHGAQIGFGVGGHRWSGHHWGGHRWGGPRWGDHRRGGGHWHGGHRYRHCTPHRAVEKASRMGLRRAWVAHVSPRTIQVRGLRYGHPTRVTFARAPHCPVIRY